MKPAFIFLSLVAGVQANSVINNAMAVINKHFPNNYAFKLADATISKVGKFYALRSLSFQIILVLTDPAPRPKERSALLWATIRLATISLMVNAETP